MDVHALAHVKNRVVPLLGTPAHFLYSCYKERLCPSSGLTNPPPPPLQNSGKVHHTGTFPKFFGGGGGGVSGSGTLSIPWITRYPLHIHGIFHACMNIVGVNFCLYLNKIKL